MIQIDAEWLEVEALVKQGLAALKSDKSLFGIHANERSITHRLAVHLEKPFDGWNVDCEYSRIEVDSSKYKKLLLPDAKNACHFDMVSSRVYPDIVVHHRGSNTPRDNLLVIEVKTKWSRVPDNQDVRKLTAFTGHYAVKQLVTYRHGLFLKFDEEGDVSVFDHFASNLMMN